MVENWAMVPEGFCDISAVLRSGIYLLANKGEVVYIGQSVKLAPRLATHIAQRGRKRNKNAQAMFFDRVWVMQVALADLDQTEKELIQRYQPKYNIKQKPVPVMSLDMLLDLMPAPCLPPCHEPRQHASWRRL
jgi:predicted GIY-YIG superfamily endonuclease